MTPRRRQPLSPLLAALAGVLAGGVLTACGSGSTATTTTTAASSAAPPAATAPAASAPAGTAAQPAATTRSTATTHASPSSSPSTPAPAARGAGGGAASFRVQGGDNSIPEYGQEASASERARAETTLAAYLRARARGDWQAACAELAAATRAQLEQLGRAAAKAKGVTEGCGPILQTLSGASAATRANALVSGVAALRVKGTTAFALFHGPRGSKYMVTMRQEGGAWKVSELAPIPYPLGTTPPAPGQ